MGKSQTGTYSWRQLVFDLHLWLGLASSIIVSILCLTGFYLALQPCLEQWMNRDLYYRSADAPLLSVTQLLERVTQGAEEPYTALEIPTDPTRNWSLRQGRQAVLVDPSTGDLLAEPRPFLEGSYMWAFRLHRWLLMERSVGRSITGAATLVFVGILLSGLVLWFQKTARKRKRGLLFKRGVSWKRFNYDSHLVLGLYAALPLLVMALSGLFWSYRTAFVATTYMILDGTSPEQKQKEKAPTAKSDAGPNYSLPYERVQEWMSQRFPDPGTLTVYFPREGEATFRVVKRREAWIQNLPAVDEVFFRTESGEVEAEELFANRTRAQKVLALIKAIHIGEIYGPFSLVLYIVCAAIGAILPISGIIMWWNRWGKRAFRRVRHRERSDD